jgi:hypothetical protein
MGWRLALLLASLSWHLTSSTEWVKGVEASTFEQSHQSQGGGGRAGAGSSAGATTDAAPRCRWNKMTKRKVCENEASTGARTSASLYVGHAEGVGDGVTLEEPEPPAALGWRPWKDKKAAKRPKNTAAIAITLAAAAAATDAEMAGAAAAPGATAAGGRPRGHAALAAATVAALAAAVPNCTGLSRDGTSALPQPDAVSMRGATASS